jgi:hypothetical protein
VEHMLSRRRARSRRSRERTPNKVHTPHLPVASPPTLSSRDSPPTPSRRRPTTPERVSKIVIGLCVCVFSCVLLTLSWYHFASLFGVFFVPKKKEHHRRTRLPPVAPTRRRTIKKTVGVCVLCDLFCASILGNISENGNKPGLDNNEPQKKGANPAPSLLFLFPHRIFLQIDARNITTRDPEKRAVRRTIISE